MSTENTTTTAATAATATDAPAATLPLWDREHVYVVQIDHRHGTDTEVYRSEDSALNSVHGYVAREWDAEVNGRWAEDGAEPQEIPADRDEAIAAYFEAVEEESYRIERLILNG